MVKSTGDGLKRGHIGGMVYRVVNGKQVIQEMPSSYRDRKSEKQLRQRSGMKNIVAMVFTCGFGSSYIATTSLGAHGPIYTIISITSSSFSVNLYMSFTV